MTGNLVEMRGESVLEEASTSPFLGLKELPPELAGPSLLGFSNLRTAMHHYEQRHITAVLDSAAGNKMDAARALGIGLSSLYRKLREMRIQVERISEPRTNATANRGARAASRLPGRSKLG